MINYFLILIGLNFIIFRNYKYISNFYNIYDYPDHKRKNHKNPTPLIGGFIIILNLLFYYIYEVSFNFELSFFVTKFEIYIFIVLSVLFFFIGYLDDKYQLNPNHKLLIFSILILILIHIDNDLLIQNVNFTFNKNFFDFSIFSYFFTILCFLLFINSFNMLDGINGQAASYSVFIAITFIIHKINLSFFVCLIFILVIFFIYNLKNKMFLGDSGSILISFIISYFFIKAYNVEQSIYPDQIVLIMLIPGFELLRLAIQRILNKKHPFKPDNEHIHHLITKHYSFLKSFIIIQAILIFPYVFYLIINNTIVSLILSTVVYGLVILSFKNKKISKRI